MRKNQLQLITLLENSRKNEDYVQLWHFLYNTVEAERDGVASNDFFYTMNLYLQSELFRLSEDYRIERALGDTLVRFRRELSQIFDEHPSIKKLSRYQKATVLSAWGMIDIATGKIDSLENNCNQGDSISCQQYKVLTSKSDSLFKLFRKYHDI